MECLLLLTFSPLDAILLLGYFIPPKIEKKKEKKWGAFESFNIRLSVLACTRAYIPSYMLLQVLTITHKSKVNYKNISSRLRFQTRCHLVVMETVRNGVGH